MNRLVLFCISIVAFCLFSSTNAVAENLVMQDSTGKLEKTGKQTGKKKQEPRVELKLVDTTDENVQREPEEIFLRKPGPSRKITDFGFIHDRPGFEFSAGIGMGGFVLLGIGGHFSFGYYFMRYFALGIEFGGNFSTLPAFTVALVPRLHIPKDKFRFTLGVAMGYGLVCEFGDSRKFNSFVLKPEVQFDWYYNDNLFVGFGLDWVGYLATESLNDYKDYHRNEVFFTTIDLYFHVGYRL